MIHEGNGSLNSKAVIRIECVTRRFGSTVAIDNVSLNVPRGSVFGLVGVNGAGKTTLIRHVLGLLRAQTGRVRVFGLDPVDDPVAVLSRIGYLSEERDLPDWMRIDELLRYQRTFYPNWDDQFVEELLQTFELDLSKKVKQLSKGQRARTGLMIALAHRPELLVLDEPSSGLDPIVRHDILAAILRTISQENRTVLFSSHLLDEVERVCDHVAMIDQGEIVLRGQLDDVQASCHCLTIRFDTPRSHAPAIDGALAVSGSSHEWTVLCSGSLDLLETTVAKSGARIVARRTPSLDEIFVAHCGNRRPSTVDD